MKLVKEDKADPIAPGDDLTYTLTLTNIGDASCTNVTLEEDYDENTTYVSATPAPTMGTNKWVVGSMLPNDVFTVDVTVSVAASENLCEAQLLNTAYYDSAQTTQGSTSENTAVVCEQEPVYDLALTKTVNDDSVRVNEKTMFTITVTNQGNQGMSNVVVKEYLPSQLRLDSNQTSQGTFDTNTMEWSVGDLAIGQTETLDLTVTVTEAGTFVNKAEVISHTETDTDSTPNNGTDNNEDDTDAASVSADNGGGSGGCVTNCGGGGGPVLPTISIVKTAGVQFTNPDTIVTYTVKVTNTSSVFGRDLVVTDTLPAPLTYVSSTLTGTWNLGDINAGETKTITYDVKYPEGIAKGNYTNIAKATISNGNSDEDDAVVEVRIPSVQGEQYAPILKIEKSVDRSFTNPGSEAVYTVVVTNVTTNNVTAKNVKLVDRMPGVFTFADNGASVHGWNLGDLLPGESRTVVYTIDVADDATNGSYDNLAAANADNAPEVYATVPLEVRQVIVEGFTLPDTNGAMNLFLSIVAGGLMIALALMIRKYRELTLIELA